MRSRCRACVSLGWRRYWQNAGYFPAAAWTLDQHLIHEESRRLRRLARRADREDDWHVNLCHAVANHHDFHAGGVRLKPPSSLVQRSETFERCLMSPNRRAARDPEKIW